MSRSVFVALAAIVTVGCTSAQLRRDTLGEAQVVGQVQQQQVLDNLAMFSANPNALPFFTEVAAGFSQVNDTATGSANPMWVRAGFSSVGSMFSGSRLNQENFTISPVTDPFRLTWMRCAYRAAVGAPLDPVECADCCAVMASWNKAYCANPLMQQCPEAYLSSLLPACGWFRIGRKCNVPKCADYVGHYRDVYLWVPPEGTEELGRLTMIIVGLASAKRQTKLDRSWNCDCPPCQAPYPRSEPCPTKPMPPKPASAGSGNAGPNPTGTAPSPASPGGAGNSTVPPADINKFYQQTIQELVAKLPQGGGGQDSGQNSPKAPSCTITETTVIGNDGGSSQQGDSGSKGGASGKATPVFQALPLFQLQ
jgi:hypothetical protein